ncbi:MAG: HU family DNA-binding protein [Gammaproteobacteria bacterium]|jgi:nucleoid DNA-binding protein
MPAKKKAPAKKPAAKKAAAPAAKKAPAKKAAAPKAAPAPKKALKVSEAMSKTAVLTHIAEATELSRKQVQSVMDELSAVIEAHVSKKGVGEFTLPGLMKVMVINKPATKARKGINPFTGEETTFKAKPASRKIKIRPLKKLKDMTDK